MRKCPVGSRKKSNWQLWFVVAEDAGASMAGNPQHITRQAAAAPELLAQLVCVNYGCIAWPLAQKAPRQLVPER